MKNNCLSYCLTRNAWMQSRVITTITGVNGQWAGACSLEAKWWMTSEGAESCTGPQTWWKAWASLQRAFQRGNLVAEKFASGRIIVFNPHSTLWQTVVLSLHTTTAKWLLFSWSQHKKRSFPVYHEKLCACAWSRSNRETEKWQQLVLPVHFTEDGLLVALLVLHGFLHLRWGRVQRKPAAPLALLGDRWQNWGATKGHCRFLVCGTVVEKANSLSCCQQPAWELWMR